MYTLLENTFNPASFGGTMTINMDCPGTAFFEFSKPSTPICCPMPSSMGVYELWPCAWAVGFQVPTSRCCYDCGFLPIPVGEYARRAAVCLFVRRPNGRLDTGLIMLFQLLWLFRRAGALNPEGRGFIATIAKEGCTVQSPVTTRLLNF